jgi:hypothetical protein
MRQIGTKPIWGLDSAPAPDMARRSNRDGFQEVVENKRIAPGVMHSPVPFVQHPLGIQHLCLWEGVVLHCLPVPFG